jgi:hypothetical protein
MYNRKIIILRYHQSTHYLIEDINLAIIPVLPLSNPPHIASFLPKLYHYPSCCKHCLSFSFIYSLQGLGKFFFWKGSERKCSRHQGPFMISIFSFPSLFFFNINKTILLSEIDQTQKDKYIMFSFICRI